MTYFQHGDVLIKNCDKVKGIKKVQGKVLKRGDTGNDHYLVGGICNIYKKDADIYLNVQKQTVLRHNEHKEIKIPKGFYKIEAVKEYDHLLEESREVKD